MGVTGSGKSTFISRLTDGPVEIGHTLESCTSDATVHTIEYGTDQNLHLIDTPGFNDTSRSDADLLKEIAFILGVLRKNEVSLAGIIYLHRISEPRIAGSALRSIRLFEALCGSQCFPYVVLVSTMWESLGVEDRAIAVDREKTLKDKAEFWGRMVNGGATVMRHEGDANSARDILSRAASMNPSVVMDIQRQLINEDKALDETSAGRYLLGELYEVRKRQKKEIAELEGIMEEALQDHDEATISAISAQRHEYEGLIQRTYTQTDDLEVTFEDLAEERADRYASLLQEGDKYEKEVEEDVKQTHDIEHTLHCVERSHDRDRGRLTIDNRRLGQQNEQHAVGNGSVELQWTWWEKLLRSALPTRDMRKAASSYRSFSFPRSLVSNHQRQSVSFPQPPEVRMDRPRSQPRHDTVPTRSKNTDSSSNGRPGLVRRSSSSQPYSYRDYRESDRSSKKQSEPILENRGQTLRNPSTMIVDPPNESRRTDETLKYNTVLVSPGYAGEIRISGPLRRPDKPLVLRRNYN
ncbi:uncharacterized protein BDZ99DRAFT_421527 [Mytilinidion resinicola]|uniref:G domain-containing protein n=1 Tax=Mytilinidion resinicola TaxID=574789 RepID=A0A6A6YF58_9PEZI|nr:uncharacterized protein BDZ99DRAFT_421527 [Mytilinidion resinicola]KAF2807466.1 hypothetical protein BDZ99DRAFT_421527 [Mytilinidion resinicola]